MSTWEQYYKKSLLRPLRPLYLKALEYLDLEASVAMDLGCGAGIEISDLLKRGFHVHAVDREQSALDLIQQSHGAYSEKLQTYAVAFEKLDPWPAVDFLFSYLALPFCERELFHEVFSRAKASIKAGGVMAASFMGPEDDWVIQNKVMGISKEEIMKKFSDRFEILHIEEKRNFGPSAASGEKYWHIIEVIAKRHR